MTAGLGEAAQLMHVAALALEAPHWLPWLGGASRVLDPCSDTDRQVPRTCYRAPGAGNQQERRIHSAVRPRTLVLQWVAGTMSGIGQAHIAAEQVRSLTVSQQGYVQGRRSAT